MSYSQQSHESPVQYDITGETVTELVHLVGRTGAIAALVSSDQIRSSHLVDLAKHLGLNPGTKAPKKNVADLIVRHVDRRIDKSLDELLAMSREEISGYLAGIQCDPGEILELLEQINLKAQAKKSRSALIEFAAIQISSLGIYQRLSENKGANG